METLAFFVLPGWQQALIFVVWGFMGLSLVTAISDFLLDLRTERSCRDGF
jgi:hypothetical protein